MHLKNFDFVQYSGGFDLSLRAQLLKKILNFLNKIKNWWSVVVLGFWSFGVAYQFLLAKIDSIQSLEIRGNWGIINNFKV